MIKPYKIGLVMPKYMLQKAQQKESQLVAWTGADSCWIWFYRTCVFFFFLWAYMKTRIQLSRAVRHGNRPAAKNLLLAAHSSMRACLCNLWGRALFCRSPLTHEARWFGG